MSENDLANLIYDINKQITTLYQYSIDTNKIKTINNEFLANIVIDLININSKIILIKELNKRVLRKQIILYCLDCKKQITFKKLQTSNSDVITKDSIVYVKLMCKCGNSELRIYSV